MRKSRLRWWSMTNKPSAGRGSVRPGALAVDPRAGLLPVDYWGLNEHFQEFVDHCGEELTAPVEVTEQAGSADGQAEEIMELVPDLAQGDTEVGPAVAAEQTSARADARARHFQVAAALESLLTAPAAVDAPPVTMRRDFRFGQCGHEVVLELAGAFDVAGSAMRALPGTDVLCDEDDAGCELGPKASGVLAIFLALAVGKRALKVRRGDGARVCRDGGCSGVGARPGPARGAGPSAPPPSRRSIAQERRRRPSKRIGPPVLALGRSDFRTGST